MDTGQFFSYWITFTILVLAATAIAIVWAWRSGHFSGQDRARYLALWAEVPEDEASSRSETRNPKQDSNNKKAGI